MTDFVSCIEKDRSHGLYITTADLEMTWENNFLPLKKNYCTQIISYKLAWLKSVAGENRLFKGIKAGLVAIPGLKPLGCEMVNRIE